MYRSAASIFFPVFLIAFLITAYWGYWEKQEKEKVLVQSEINYQRSFHSLSDRLNQIESNLGKSLVVNSEQNFSRTMMDVWKLSYAAQNDVGALPLRLFPLHKTENFLTRISHLSNGLAIRDLKAKPLSPQEYETLEKLHRSAQQIQKELHQVQNKVLSQQIHWTETEKALLDNKKPKDKTLLDGFQTIEQHVDGTSTLNWGDHGRLPLELEAKKMERNLQGPAISLSEAEERSFQFAGIQNRKKYQVTATENGEGKRIPSFHVRIEPKQGNQGALVQFDVAKRGGSILWMMNHRQVGKATIDLDQAGQRAFKFLVDRGFSNMQILKRHQYGDVATFQFVNTIGDVLIYPDEVTVKVALDDGSIIGFQGDRYAISNHPRQLAPARLTLSQAKEHINPRLKLEESRLVLIENELGEEVLCYEFIGTMNHKGYQVYINAHHGTEEKVKPLNNWDDLLG